MEESQLEIMKKGPLGKLRVGAIIVRVPGKVRQRKGLPTPEEALEIEKSLIFIDPEANDRFVNLLMKSGSRKHPAVGAWEEEAHDRFVDLLMATR